MKLSDLDRLNGGATARCLQWVNTLLHSPSVPWTPAQREAATRDLLDALQAQESELLKLAQDAHARRQEVECRRCTMRHPESGACCGVYRHLGAAMERRGRQS